MRKPRTYRKGKYQRASCLNSFKVGNKELPRAVSISCEEMNAKDARKLAAWLVKSAKWIESK